MRRLSLKRVGALAAAGAVAVFVLAWAFSGWWSLDVAWKSWRVELRSGLIEIAHYHFPKNLRPFRGFECVPLSRLPMPMASWRWWFHVNHWLGAVGPASALGPVGTSVQVPFWVLGVGAGGTAAFVWRRHFRRPGHCPKCGYDLTGNTTGVCPECGRSAGA